MSDASDADLQEQSLPVLDDDEPTLVAAERAGIAQELERDPEVPEADAVEQHLPVPDDEGYEGG